MLYPPQSQVSRRDQETPPPAPLLTLQEGNRCDSSYTHLGTLTASSGGPRPSWPPSPAPHTNIWPCSLSATEWARPHATRTTFWPSRDLTSSEGGGREGGRQCLSKSGVPKLWPVGQIWPAHTFGPALWTIPDYFFINEIKRRKYQFTLTNIFSHFA